MTGRVALVTGGTRGIGLAITARLAADGYRVCAGYAGNEKAAKAGVIGFSKALAQETANKGITVNVVAPGYIDTEMVAGVPPQVLEKIVAGIPVGRLGRAEEIAACVAFLARDDASFITGATITANGGQYFAS